jgi:Protein of unknown function (DUF3142)
MARFPRNRQSFILALTLAALCVRTRGDRDPVNVSAARLFPATMPRTVLWAWEEPEDLRAADPQRVGVAFLAGRVFIGDQVNLVPRRQPILVAPGIWAEAVVRLESTSAFHDDAAIRNATAQAILTPARLPGIRAVQIDFDATPSQQAFYADLLRQVRAALPRGERLEITALVSWCAQPQGWLHALPVDAAIPMDFRLGRHAGVWAIREPLCAGAIGVSTDEPANRPIQILPNRVTYVFAPRPFTGEQLALLNQGKIPADTKGAR